MKYCTLYNFAGKREIIPVMNSDFQECLAAYVAIMKMKPKEELLPSYVNSVVWSIYNCVNMKHMIFSHFLLRGVLTKMGDVKSYSGMREFWDKQVKTMCAGFTVHTNTIKLVESVILRGQSGNIDLNEDLRTNINDLMYVSFFIRCAPLRDLNANQFMLLAKELMSPTVSTVQRLEKLLADPVSVNFFGCPVIEIVFLWGAR